MQAGIYDRIVVVGPSGSGKTTLARNLSQRLGLIHVELDALHWEANWTEVSSEVMYARTDAALPVDSRWAVDGNYSVVREIVWRRADSILWLDYPLGLALRQLWGRSYRRWRTQEELWNGNRERMIAHLDPRPKHNLFLWTITNFRKRRREYPIILRQPQFSHLHVVRLHSPQETTEWLRSLTINRTSRNEGQASTDD